MSAGPGGLDTVVHLGADDSETGIWVVTRGDEVAVVDGALPVGPRPDWLPASSGSEPALNAPDMIETVLGRLDGVPARGVAFPPGHSIDGVEFVHLFMFAGQVPELHSALAGRAVQLARFARTHRFCSACGGPTESHATDRASQCPECGHLTYPPVTPAIITIVERDDEILLAHGRQFPIPVYSALAGFVEPGERAEAAVVREVFEEVGVVVGDVRYQSSQPWPFPHSLMLGFTCRWVSGDISIDPTEIVDAGWFRADDMPAMFPGRTSIANWLIGDWLDRRSQ